MTRVSTHLSGGSSPDKLFNFNCKEDHGRQCHDQHQIMKRQGLCLEDGIQERDVQGRHLEGEGQQDCPQEIFIGEETYLEQGLLFRPNREDMAKLGQTEHGEHHGLPVAVSALDRPRLNSERDPRHEHSDPDGMETEAVGKDAFFRMPRGTLHDVSLLRLD
ncbi:MAG: hypothetical protein H6Q48_5205, partial [Deltaproteobacteria bacterium]|nr:hypothetical protein [Deltaproteobacteria bacterium]